MWRTWFVRATLVLVVPLALGACGTDDDDGVATLGGGSGDRAAGASPSVDPEDALLDWARCMREHGIDVPDPQVDENGGVQIMGPAPGQGGTAPDREAFQEAQEACQDLMPEGGPMGDDLTPEERAELQDQILEWAQCMREHGIDVPDPTFNDEGGVDIRMGDRGGVDPSDPAFRDAEEACGQPGDVRREEAP